MPERVTARHSRPLRRPVIKMEHFCTTQPPAPPAVSRIECMLRQERQEILKDLNQPNMHTACESHWVTTYMESYGPQGDLPRAIRTMKPPFQNTPERCPVYQANYGRKKKQNLLPSSAEKNTTGCFQCISESKWMTHYTENFGFQRVVQQKPPKKVWTSTFKTTPDTLFVDKYRRTEYQAVYGPKFRTAHFNTTLYRQIHGTA
ncbi:hypothetical protein HF521_003839 [Silurus meridionalis]|uniref:Uncharacterized protein n=2 Tax=Silurus meridionalis TaxID=175797 RepID=A0A8T0AZH7_SILME|nr:hypothetical protein HF521_003839 [Silurus meridionalis]